MERTSNSRREELKPAAENGVVVASSEDRDLHDDADHEVDSIERIFESIEVPPWRSQLTFRAFFVSFVLSVLFTFIVMKLNLTTGLIPCFSVSASLLGFFFVKTWTKFLQISGLLKQNFTRQENTVIQTCIVATSGIASNGEDKYYIFRKGTYKVGRKGCDVIINKDKGVSRIHVEIVVDAMVSLDHLQNKSSNVSSKVRIRDCSKYGTFINKNLGSKEKVHEFPNKETTLKDGDLISFGTGNATYKFCFVPLVFFVHCPTLFQENQLLQDKISSIGISLVVELVDNFDGRNEISKSGSLNSSFLD
ncbi:hypothetical protein F0562_004065 [Nyssa sinensis]|uniref:FHA domain-containing protein n=1 Tax=Nyssa sinensis TaxID=561372 RepID=A0A5J5BYB4_9ASTE|nr:hypothetical protein F0562_004065 [Nyssa sinensis]